LCEGPARRVLQAKSQAKVKIQGRWGKGKKICTGNTLMIPESWSRSENFRGKMSCRKEGQSVRKVGGKPGKKKNLIIEISSLTYPIFLPFATMMTTRDGHEDERRQKGSWKRKKKVWEKGSKSGGRHKFLTRYARRRM